MGIWERGFWGWGCGVGGGGKNPTPPPPTPNPTPPKNFILYGVCCLGMGVGGLGMGPTPHPPIPNPHSPIPNPHICVKFFYKLNKIYINEFINILIKLKIFKYQGKNNKFEIYLYKHHKFNCSSPK